MCFQSRSLAPDVAEVWLAGSGAGRDGDTLVNWWLRSRDLVPLPRRAAFDSLVILVARQLWLECNDRIFHATACLPAQLIAKLTRTVDDWSNAGLLARSMLYRE
jgi:hypothetical protein